MASSRDDFVIAIRSAFLKKSYQQKFSLLTLIFLSLIVIVLGSFNFKPIQYIKIGINEVVYRSSFIASIPENYFKDLNIKIEEHLELYDRFKKNEIELKKLKEEKLSNDFLILENKKLRELINETVQSEDVYAKVLVDKDSPYLKSIILNKGSKDNIKIGTNIYDQSYLVGRVIEVNFKTSRVLLLSDLNSNVPVTIAPQNIQAIVTGTGDNYGQIKYIKDGLSKEIEEESIIYTSGTGAIFKSGIPIGTLEIIKENSSDEFSVEFYSDFSQLKYVFAEITSISEIPDQNVSEPDNETNNSINAKLCINTIVSFIVRFRHILIWNLRYTCYFGKNIFKLRKITIKFYTKFIR